MTALTGVDPCLVYEKCVLSRDERADELVAVV